MKDECHDIRERLVDVLARDLPPEESADVEHHVAGCAECRRYRDALESDDRRLDAFAASMGGLASRIQDGVLGTAAESTPAGRSGRGMDQPAEPGAGRSLHWLDRPSVRVAVAASVIVAIALISYFSNRTSPPDIIWANVFRQVDESISCTARGVHTEAGEEYDVVIYESPEFGQKQVLSQGGDLVHCAYVDYFARVVTLVQYNDSTYLHLRMDPTTLKIFKNKSVFNSVSRMKGRDHTILGITEIDGVTVSGIEVADTVVAAGVASVHTVRLFVDLETGWPVRIEAGNEPGAGVAEMNFVMDDFEWHTTYRYMDFEAEIPAGFRKQMSFGDIDAGPSAHPEVDWNRVFDEIRDPPAYVSRHEVYHDGTLVSRSVISYSRNLGFRRDRYQPDTLSFQSAYNAGTGRNRFTHFNSRTSIERNVPFQTQAVFERSDPLSKIRSLSAKPHEPLSVTEIDGVRVSGFEITDTRLHDGEKKVSRMRIYVETATNLPRLVEFEGVTARRLTRVKYNWRPEFSDAYFDPAVPEGFFAADVDRPIEELVERATDGLRRFAGVAGRYPEELWFVDLRDAIDLERSSLEREGRLPTGVLDDLESVLHAGVLREWHDGVSRSFRAGEIPTYDPAVKPGDAGGVLIRWRMDDRIGVIYGDMSFGYADRSRFASQDREIYGLEDDS